MSTVIVKCDYCGDKAEKPKSDYKKTDGTYCTHECYTSDRREEYDVKKCPVCGDEFQPRDQHNNIRQTCSRSCGSKLANRNRDVHKVECDNCGELFEKAPCKVRESNYCSTTCMGEDWEGENGGADNPNYKGGDITTSCENCGKSFTHSRSVDRTYCSYACMGESYQGGPHSRVNDDNVRYYGPNWRKQRSKRMEQDNGRCVCCGMSDKQHTEKHSFGLHCHHVLPIRLFQDETGDTNWNKANDIGNLRMLCKTCHDEWEGIPIAPQT